MRAAYRGCHAHFHVAGEGGRSNNPSAAPPRPLGGSHEYEPSWFAAATARDAAEYSESLLPPRHKVNSCPPLTLSASRHTGHRPRSSNDDAGHAAATRTHGAGDAMRGMRLLERAPLERVGRLPIRRRRDSRSPRDRLLLPVLRRERVRPQPTRLTRAAKPKSPARPGRQDPDGTGTPCYTAILGPGPSRSTVATASNNFDRRRGTQRALPVLAARRVTRRLPSSLPGGLGTRLERLEEFGAGESWADHRGRVSGFRRTRRRTTRHRSGAFLELPDTNGSGPAGAVEQVHVFDRFRPSPPGPSSHEYEPSSFTAVRFETWLSAPKSSSRNGTKSTAW